MLDKYNVENPTQLYEFFIKSQKSGKNLKLHKDTNLSYRGTYEKDFLDYCYMKNIEVNKGPTIKYNIDNVNRYYHSDFYLPKFNLIIEIKSKYYFDLYMEVNLLKEEYTKCIGYDFMFVIDKNYSEIELFFNNN